MNNFLLLGYYGFGNFGDEAILGHIINIIKAHVKDPNITVFTSDVEKTSEEYQLKSVYRFSFRGIIDNIFSCDYLILGGGSLLQNVTSLKSLLYYLFMIFIARLFDKKVVLFAQGIGPLNGYFSRNLTINMLRQACLITVRDEKSKNLLDKYGIRSFLTADLLWTLNLEGMKDEKTSSKQIVGIQLRGWRNLSHQKLILLAEAVLNKFDAANTIFKIISLQSSLDSLVCQKFLGILKSINNKTYVEFINDKNVEKELKTIANLDYLVAMRFHAGLASIKAGVPTMMLSYDPKVEELAKGADLPFVDVKNLNKKNLEENLDKLLTESEEIVSNMKKFEVEMEAKSAQNVKLLLKLLNKYKDLNKEAVEEEKSDE